jgi:vacuolar-type H+-ATPase subunit I/STV1
MTDADRQQRRRDRLKAGLVRVEAWVPAHAVEAVEAAIQRAVRDALVPHAAADDAPREA